MSAIVRSASDLLLGERSRLTNQIALQLYLLFVMLEQEPRLKLLTEMETQLLVILARSTDTRRRSPRPRKKPNAYVDFIGPFLLPNFELHQNILNQWISASRPPQALNHCLLERDHLIDNHRRCTIVDSQDTLILNSNRLVLAIINATTSIVTVVSSSNIDCRCCRSSDRNR